jgi:hypothetical protein
MYLNETYNKIRLNFLSYLSCSKWSEPGMCFTDIVSQLCLGMRHNKIRENYVGLNWYPLSSDKTSSTDLEVKSDKTETYIYVSSSKWGGN